MTADIEHLSGLRGANLAAFRSACDLIEANALREHQQATQARRAEDLLRDMRKLLGFADELTRRDPRDRDYLELADAFVARASNRLAASLLLSERAS